MDGYERARFADALVQAWKDAVMKERQFTTPLSLCAKRPQPEPPATPHRPDSKGEGKGGKGQKCDDSKKLKTSKAKQGYSRTLDGEPIRFRYNAKNGCEERSSARLPSAPKRLRARPRWITDSAAILREASSRHRPGTSVQAYPKKLAASF